MQRTLSLLALLLAFSIFSACVSVGEFRKSVARSEELAQANRGLQLANDSLRLVAKEQAAANARQQGQIQQLTKDSLARGMRLALAQEQLARLQKDYQDLETVQRGLVEGSQRETARLLGELQRMQQELQRREDAVKSLEQTLYQRKLELDQVAKAQHVHKERLDSMGRALHQQRLDMHQLRRALAQKDSLAGTLRARVADALLGFEGKGLKVEQRNGRVYVSLEEKLMFRSGSYEVDPKGREALRQLVPVLEQHDDIHVLVEGHTDDVPMRGSGSITDNWDLSVKRATSIVRVLITGTKIAPSRVSAAGRAEFQPLDAAKTAEARQRNRRTEIVLTPRLDDVLRAVGL